jgi:hypothetical protein
MDIRVIIVADFLAAQALLATVYGSARASDGLLAAQGFGQRGGYAFKVGEILSCEEVGMAKALSLQRTLEQFDALALIWKIAKSHPCDILAKAARGDNLFSNKQGRVRFSQKFVSSCLRV